MPTPSNILQRDRAKAKAGAAAVRVLNDRPSKRVTLSMVAAEVGLGITTVSDILNRGAASRYTPDTCRRVQEVVDRIGYTPHRAAQTMKRGRSGLIGLLLTRDFSNPYWASFADTTEKALRLRGYLLQLAVCVGDPANEQAQMERLLGEQVEGVIIGPVFETADLERHQTLLRGQLPTVTYGFADNPFDSVLVDEHRAGQLVADHLLQLGHRRLCLMGVPDADLETMTQSKRAGFCGRIADAGLSIVSPWLHRQMDDGHVQDAYDAGHWFVDQWNATAIKDRPTAVFCHNDLFASGFLCALAERGLRVPDDLSVVGFDNLASSRYMIPPLTTVDSQVAGVIESSIELLVSRIMQPEAHRQVRVIEPQLITRASVRDLQQPASSPSRVSR